MPTSQKANVRITDVIFLGAGASKGAGFPLNKELTHYIIEAPVMARFSDEGVATSRQQDAVHEVRRRLGLACQPSVDQFCQQRGDQNETMWIKLLIRAGLVGYANDPKLGNHNWRTTANLYREFVSSLFLPHHFLPESRFAVVNFNYDGLLSKMLTDAVLSRSPRDPKTQEAARLSLAWIGGGYIHNRSQSTAAEIRLNQGQPLPECFLHFLPHGTITVVDSDGALLSLERLIYPDDGGVDLDDLWRRTYRCDSRIDFPWEPDKEAALVHREQMRLASQAVEEAKRYHFIGISGHPLMQNSLKAMFRSVPGYNYNSKEWFIAAPIEERKRSAYFSRLCKCLLPQSFAENDDWQAKNLAAPQYYGGFREWIEASPHNPDA